MAEEFSDHEITWANVNAPELEDNEIHQKPHARDPPPAPEPEAPETQKKRARDPEPEPPAKKQKADNVFTLKTLSFVKDKVLSFGKNGDCKSRTGKKGGWMVDVNPKGGRGKAILRLTAEDGARISYNFGVDDGVFGVRVHVEVSDELYAEIDRLNTEFAVLCLDSDWADLPAMVKKMPREDQIQMVKDTMIAPFGERIPKNRVTDHQAAKTGKPKFAGDGTMGYYPPKFNFALPFDESNSPECLLFQNGKRVKYTRAGTGDKNNFLGINGMKLNSIDVPFSFLYKFNGKIGVTAKAGCINYDNTPTNPKLDVAALARETGCNPDDEDALELAPAEGGDVE